METYTHIPTTFERMVDKLPYYLQNGEHIKAYYKSFAILYDELIDIFSDILNFMDVDQAEGYALDLIGDTMNCPRVPPYTSDEEYRRMLKVQIMKNNSSGRIEDINEIAKSLMGDIFLGLKQGYQSLEFNNEPAMIEVNVSADKISEKTTKTNTVNLKSGTVNSGTHKIGVGIEGIPTKITQKKFKGIEIPNLKYAIPIGVRLEYDIKSKPNIIKVKPRHVTTFKYNSQTVKCISKQTLTKLCLKNIIKVISEYNIYNIMDLECGVPFSGAEVGVLL